MGMIEVSNISKSFYEWQNRPRSIKTMMSKIVMLKFELGNSVEKEDRANETKR